MTAQRAAIVKVGERVVGHVADGEAVYGRVEAQPDGTPGLVGIELEPLLGREVVIIPVQLADADG